MSQVKIQNFNYFTSGNNSKMFNLDLQYDDGTVENGITFFGGVEKHDDLMDGEDACNKFSAKCLSGNEIIHPLFDIKDSAIRTTLKNNDGHLEIYSPALSDNPIDFTQVNDTTYVLTQPTKYSMATFITTLQKQRSQDSSTITDKYYQMNLVQHDKHTYIYGSNDKNDLSSSFGIEYDLKDINYNLILEIPQSTEYEDLENGDFYGDMIFGKNNLNNIYSMDMNSLSNLENSRIYAGLYKSGNIVYLKYYDNIGYYGGNTSNNGNGITDIEMNENTSFSYPYQKIEVLSYVNKFNYNSMHKSNLYSMTINGLELSSSNNAEKIDQIKTNIKNVIRQIVKDVCPVNTQLFDVYFQ